MKLMRLFRLFFLLTVLFCASVLSMEAKEKLGSPYRNWGLYNSVSSHINVFKAWALTEGSREVIVAVIDTGVDITHKSLEVNVWRDPVNADVYGWNFTNNAKNPKDFSGHGTHIAGIIGAVANKYTGVSGVAHKVSIMPIKYFSETNSGMTNVLNTAKSIHYAIDHGAKIINYSGGGPAFSREEFLAIQRAESAGILFVSAAGNEHQNTDLRSNYYFPASYRLSNMISVASTDMYNYLLPSSNWGKHTVDVAGPGQNIWSTLPDGRYGYMTGTSQATAFVSGVAVLLLAQNPKLTPQEIKSIILNSADQFPQLSDRLVSGGRVNAYSALLSLQRIKKYVK